jgi:hypothetical protein
MLRLTLQDHRSAFVEPSGFEVVLSENGGSTVHVMGGSMPGITVAETPEQICAMRATWERRFSICANSLGEFLPAYVYFNADHPVIAVAPEGKPE